MELGSGQNSSGESTALRPMPSFPNPVIPHPTMLLRGTGTGKTWMGKAVLAPAMR